MASINDVAKLAGVSKSTVSKVLNNYENVTPKTKKLVMDAVEELNYVPNQIAVALAKNDTRKVALVVDPTNDNQTIDGINAKYLLGAVQKLDELNIEVVTLFSSLFSKYSNEELEMYLIKRGITGIIFFGIPQMNESMNYLIDKETFKIVLVDVNKYNKCTSAISIDNYRAQYNIVETIVEKYRLKKILYISGEDGGDTGIIRKKAIVDFMENNDIEVEIHDGHYSEQNSQSIVNKYGARFDAIVCASDIMAIGAARALKQQKLNRHVIGFDGIDLLAYIEEKILTVIQDFALIGELAANEINDLFNGKLGEKKYVAYKIGYVQIQDVIK